MGNKATVAPKSGCERPRREILSDPKLKAKAVQYVFEHVKAGDFKPRIDRVLPFAQIVEAHRYMESNEQIGKIVVTV
jgi:NADPH:quinone reductase-like Zn-dependent oxidoreductase